MANAVHIVSIIVYFIVSLIASWSPMMFVNKVQYMSFLNIFAAGIFLAIGLMTILPEATEFLEDLGDDTYAFPWAHFLTVVGFLIMFAVEEIIHMYFERTFNNTRSTEVPTIGHAMQEENGKTPVANYNGVPNSPVHVVKETEHQVTMQSAVVLLVALSIHEILEGFSIGALDDPSWGLFFAILFHKIVESFAVGAAFVRAGTSKVVFWTFMLIYGVTLSLGIAIGLAAATTGSTTTGIVLALSAGSFLFIATVEILSEEFGQKAQQRWMRFSALVAGFLLMALLIFIEEYAEKVTGASSEAGGSSSTVSASSSLRRYV